MEYLFHLIFLPFEELRHPLLFTQGLYGQTAVQNTPRGYLLPTFIISRAAVFGEGIVGEFTCRGIYLFIYVIYSACCVTVAYPYARECRNSKNFGIGIEV